jgi:hypothetical protein
MPGTEVDEIPIAVANPFLNLLIAKGRPAAIVS